MAQLLPLPLTVSCYSKIQIGFTFLVPAYPGSPGKRAVKRVCVCVCVTVCDRYLYSGRILLSVDNVLGLLILADKYDIVDLKSSCMLFMRRHLVAQEGCECHAVPWYQFSLAHCDPDLQQACFSYIIFNMDDVMPSANWISLDLDNLVAILCRCDIIVCHEYAILKVQP